MQAATLEGTKIAASRERRGFSERDLWELWLLDEAAQVACGSIRSFLHYLCSEGTQYCEIYKASPLVTGSAGIMLTGPLADDQRKYFLRYRLTRGNLGKLREAEKELLVSTLIVHYSPIEEGFNGRWRLTRMKHEKRFLLTSLIASAFDHEKGGDPNVKVSIEVHFGTARFTVAVQAPTIQQALNIAATRCPGGVVRAKSPNHREGSNVEASAA